MVIALADLKIVAKNNPFTNQRNEDVRGLHVTFLSGEPEQAKLQQIKTGQYGSDEYVVKGKAIYLCCPHGSGKSKLNNNFFEKKLNVTATTRNWNTITALVGIGEKK